MLDRTLDRLGELLLGKVRALGYALCVPVRAAGCRGLILPAPDQFLYVEMKDTALSRPGRVNLRDQDVRTLP